MMELVCEKYLEKMDSALAFCKHAGEYCKFRSSCMIHFTLKENQEKPKE